MAKEKSNALLIIGIILVGILLYKYSVIGAISLSSPQVQYYNKPISAVFITENTDFSYQAYFNDAKINTTLVSLNLTCPVNQTCEEKKYSITLNDTKQEGTFKVILTRGNASDIVTIEVRKPFVDSKNDIPFSLETGREVDFYVKTFNPQNESMMADSVKLKITGPDNDEDIVEMIKGTDKFTASYDFKKAGNYVTKIIATKEGYDSIEKTTITAVLKSGGVPTIMWVWIIMVVVIVILVLGRAFLWRKR